MSYISTGINNSPVNNNNTVGNPSTGGGDGINWPYNPNGQTPNYSINWNSVPPPTVQQIEETYEKLINWLKSNIGSAAFYNGAILLLQMTTEIGQHMGNYPNSDLGKFISNQVQVTVNGQSETLLQLIIDVAAQGSVVSQSTFQGGVDAAQQFLAQLANLLKGLSGLGVPFNQMLEEATKDQGTINLWAWQHYADYKDRITGKEYSTWMDDNGNPMTFDDFTQFAQNQIGLALVPADSSYTSADQAIDAFYQTQIEQLVQQFKGNPWALLAALMALMNQRDEDKGVSVNGYASVLDLISQANAIVKKMIGDISGTTPNATDFYQQLKLLQNLVGRNPALASILPQFESQIGTINSSTTNIFGNNQGLSWSESWSVGPGVYHFPPGSTIQVTVNGVTKQELVGNDGIVYFSDPSLVQIYGNASYSFGMLAAMGDTQAIVNAMSDFSSITMSNFLNGVTGLQSLMNSMSPAIQQMVQNETQTMQALENFEKLGYQNITDVNQQIMRNVQAVMA